MTHLPQYLRELCLSTMRACYEQEAEQARQGSLTFEQYLEQVAMREVESRHQRRRDRYLKESHLPLEKKLESFDRRRLPAKVNNQFSVLLEGSFTKRKDNVLVFGNPGSGKSHLLCALSHELIQQGRRVLYTNGSSLVQELLHAKSEFRLPRALRRYELYDAVLVDDFGYVQHSREEMGEAGRNVQLTALQMPRRGKFSVNVQPV